MHQTLSAGSKGLADEEVNAPALAGVGDVEARVDVLLGEDEEAEAGPAGGQELLPGEGMVVAVDLAGGEEGAGADALREGERQDAVFDLSSEQVLVAVAAEVVACLLYTSPSPRD